MAKTKDSRKVEKVVTKLRVSREKVLTTVIIQPSFKREMEKLPHKVIVSEDGTYSASLIRQWEHPEMFRTARQRCVYDILMCYLDKLQMRIEAPSSIDALNVVKEAAVVLASQGFLNSLFTQWLRSCYDAFEKHVGTRLVGNRP